MPERRFKRHPWQYSVPKSNPTLPPPKPYRSDLPADRQREIADRLNAEFDAHVAERAQ